MKYGDYVTICSKEIPLCNGISLVYKSQNGVAHSKEQMMELALKDLTSKLYIKNKKIQDSYIAMEYNEIDRLKTLNKKLVDSIHNISKKL